MAFEVNELGEATFLVEDITSYLNRSTLSAVASSGMASINQLDAEVGKLEQADVGLGQRVTALENEIDGGFYS
jgi:hypothetical protein